MNRISIHDYHYIPENPIAKLFLASFGFVEVGARRDRDGEVIAVLKL